MKFATRIFQVELVTNADEPHEQLGAAAIEGVISDYLNDYTDYAGSYLINVTESEVPDKDA